MNNKQFQSISGEKRVLNILMSCSMSRVFQTICNDRNVTDNDV